MEKGKAEFMRGWKAGAARSRRRVKKYKRLNRLNRLKRRGEPQTTFWDGSSVWDLK